MKGKLFSCPNCVAKNHKVDPKPLKNHSKSFKKQSKIIQKAAFFASFLMVFEQKYVKMDI